MGEKRQADKKDKRMDLIARDEDWESGQSANE